MEIGDMVYIRGDQSNKGRITRRRDGRGVMAGCTIFAVDNGVRIDEYWETSLSCVVDNAEDQMVEQPAQLGSIPPELDSEVLNASRR